MKRSEFLKRLGLGMTAAIYGSSIYAAAISDDLHENNGNNIITSGNHVELKITITHQDGSVAGISDLRMQIKNNSNDIYLKNGSGLSVNGNTIDIDAEIPHGEYDYELTTNNEFIAKGKLRI